MGPTGFTQTIHMPNGQEITLNTGRYAKQADGSVVLRCGDTVILATVCSATEVAPETDFFPLSTIGKNTTPRASSPAVSLNVRPSPPITKC